MSNRISATTTTVDRPDLDAAWLAARTLTVAIRPVTPHLRRNHDLPLTASWAAVAYDSDGHSWVWLTDVDPGIGNLVTTAWMLATEDGARFVAPDATCEYCGLPADPGRRFCPPTLARDCAALHSESEAGYRTRGATMPLIGDVLAGNALSGRDLPAVA